MKAKPVSHYVVGLIIGLVIVVCFLAFYFAGYAFNKSAISYLPVLLFAAIVIISIIQWSKANDYNVTFGSCFAYGFKATAIASLIIAAFTLIFILSFPDYKEQFVAFMSSEMEKNNDITDEQKEQGLQMMGKFFTLSAVGGGLIMNLIVGAIAALIGAAVAKKNPRDPFQQPV